MHAITFQFKRVHLRGVAFGKSVLEKRVKDMTPARFDLMYAIRIAVVRPGGRSWPGGVSSDQADIRQRLGLHPSTVSKMIKRLVEMGWLAREKDSWDRRRNVIVLTALGMRKIVKAMRIVFQMRTHMKHFEDHFRGHARNTGRRILDVIGDFWEEICSIARSFGDETWLPYDFGWAGPYG